MEEYPPSRKSRISFRSLIPLAATLALSGSAFYKYFENAHNQTYHQYREMQQKLEDIQKKRAAVHSISLKPEYIPADMINQYKNSRDGALHALDMRIAETEQKIADYDLSEMKSFEKWTNIWLEIGLGIALVGGAIATGLWIRTSRKETP